jgi:uncharacterized repeat protein (TIGR02543 family)
MKLSFKTILPILLIFTLLILFTGCFITLSPGYTPPTYTVTYNGNTNTSGVVSTDANLYEQGVSVTVLAPGSLVKTGYTFGGWNTAADGSGTSQAAGSSFNMGTANVTLYAQWMWTANPTYTPSPGYIPPTYTVTYNGNGSTSGAVPIDANLYEQGVLVMVLDKGSLVKTGYTFGGWDTAADGSGTSQAAGSSFNMGTANVTLYAQWTANPLMGGAVSITGTAKFGQTLTANISGLIYTPAAPLNVPTYQWKRAGVAIDGATATTYTLVEADITTVITVTVTADGTHATGSVTSAPTAAVAKADGPAAPAAPTEASKTQTTVVLHVITGAEYNVDGGTWQDGVTFTGLTANTAYQFRARIKATATYLASADSAATTITTNALPVMGGAVSITGTAKFGQTLTANISGLIYTPAAPLNVPTYQWKRAGVAIDGATATTYTLVEADITTVITVTVTADGTHATGSVTSAPTAAVAKADGPAAPAAPTEASKTQTTVVLHVITGAEYNVDGGTWQDGVTFTGLTANTNYKFRARIKATATTNESLASAFKNIKTNK